MTAKTVRKPTRADKLAQMREEAYDRGYVNGAKDQELTMNKELQVKEVEARIKLMNAAGQAMSAIAQTINGDFFIRR